MKEEEIIIKEQLPKPGIKVKQGSKISVEIWERIYRENTKRQELSCFFVCNVVECIHINSEK